MGNMAALTPRLYILQEKIGWRKPMYIHGKPESRSAHSNTRRPPGRSPVASDLSSYKSDKTHNNVPQDPEDAPVSSNKDVTPPPPISELFAQIQAGLKKKDTPDLADKIPEPRPGLAPQDQESIQPIASASTDVQLNPTKSVSTLPWIPEKVLFAHGAVSEFPLGFINRGAFGSVFLVRHRDRRDLAALKVVQIQKGLSDTLVGEIHALTRIRGACNRFVLRQPVGVGEVMWTSDSGHLHLLFDLYIGSLNDHRGLPGVNDDRFLGLVIAELHSGLAHLHGLGFIHKDLKPCNILIDRDGHCVIADVGGSEIIPGISPTDPVTKRSPGVITPEFAAPEFYYKDKNKKITYTQAVDLWSLGATLCDLITARLPGHLARSGRDDGYSVQALGLDPTNLHKTLRESKCPEGVTEVIMQLCRLSPEQRLNIEGLDRAIYDNGWNIPLGHYSPFPVDSTKSAVVLPSGPSSIDEDAMRTAGHAAEGIAEFDTALKELGLSVPKLVRFRSQHAKTEDSAANEVHPRVLSL